MWPSLIKSRTRVRRATGGKTLGPVFELPGARCPAGAWTSMGPATRQPFRRTGCCPHILDGAPGFGEDCVA